MFAPPLTIHETNALPSEGMSRIENIYYYCISYSADASLISARSHDTATKRECFGCMLGV